jgi:putative oxidoreductase
MLQRIISTNAGWFTVPIRLALGILFIAHGSQKVLGAFGGRGLVSWTHGTAPLGLQPSWLWLGASALSELVGGILVMLGLLTRVGAFLIFCVMAVAVFGVHWGAFFSPAGIEFPVSLLAAALALMISGGGELSIDRRLMRGGPSRRKYVSR